MKTVIINASPKTESGASTRIASILMKFLTKETDCLLLSASSSSEKIAQELKDAKAVIWVFPLYVDSIPSHLLALMEKLGPQIFGQGINPMVYAVINCGFWEAAHNRLALDQMRYFADQAHLPWGSAVALGGGGATEIGPLWLFHRNMTKAMAHLASQVLQSQSGPDVMVEINLPRPLYKLAANLRWRFLAFQNGLAQKDLFRRPQ
ncbi:MAG: NAD(P)H-dependent oxidoreductase [Deltaproteobacteria bacterium]|jgi:hypothetical protein|nr:NAD(P)H-dependent oxidoreductase [Deltaproteobacteria bacterium]